MAKTHWMLNVGPGANLPIDPTVLHQLGFVCQQVDFNDPNFANNELILAIPNWLFFAAIFLTPIVIGVRRFKASRIADRRLKGLCIYCAYDLRASQLKCPECGTPTGLAAEAASPVGDLAIKVFLYADIAVCR